MDDYVLFQMSSRHREQLIERHKFYVQQAQLRLLDQFTEEAISQEADRIAQESWERHGQYFNPDYHDQSEFAERAYDDGVWRYQLLTDLRDGVRMSIIVGFFHVWEKNLRQWLVNEVRHWHYGDAPRDMIWKVKLADIFDLLESFGWPLKSSVFFTKIDACRLVVNVHKHGDGASLKELSDRHPAYLKHPIGTILGEISGILLRTSHEDLNVTEANLEEFSEAIIRFWEAVPENVLNSQISDPPDWLVKAIEKDC